MATGAYFHKTLHPQNFLKLLLRCYLPTRTEPTDPLSLYRSRTTRKTDTLGFLQRYVYNVSLRNHF